MTFFFIDGGRGEGEGESNRVNAGWKTDYPPNWHAARTAIIKRR